MLRYGNDVLERKSDSDGRRSGGGEKMAGAESRKG
jgi:hypothetical protein